MIECNQQCIKNKEICCIYLIMRRTTKQKYIGQTINLRRRIRDHINNKNDKYSWIDQAINKYGWEEFDIVIIEELPKDPTLLNDKEIFWIDFFNTYHNETDYNLTPGGSEPLWGEDHPGYKGYYRVISKGYDKNGWQRYSLIDKDNKNIKMSLDQTYLNVLAYQLNNHIIDEIPDDYCHYYVGTGNKRNGRQQYILFNPHNTILKSSFFKNKLEDLAYKLNNNIITESTVKSGKREYHLKKTGVYRGKQQYAIVNPNGFKVVRSVQKELLDNLLYQLKNDMITEDDVKNKISGIRNEYRITKSGWTNNKRQYAIINPDGERLCTSIHKKEIYDLLYQLKNGTITEDDAKKNIKLTHKNKIKKIYRVHKAGKNKYEQPIYILYSPDKKYIKRSIFYEVLQTLADQLNNNLITEEEVKNIDIASYLVEHFTINSNI